MPRDSELDAILERIPTASAEFRARVEDSLRSETVRLHARRIPILGLCAVAAALVVMLLASRHVAARPRLTFQIVDLGQLEEERFALSEILERSDLVLAGVVRAKPRAGRFQFDVLEVVRGRAKQLRLQLRNARGFTCPAPPHYRDGTFVVLFLVDGAVPTGQWMVEFRSEHAMRGFLARLRGYFDHSVIPTLVRELLAGGGKQPFSEVDRLAIDVVALLQAARDAAGLVDLVRFYDDRFTRLQAISALSVVGGRRAAAGLTRLWAEPALGPELKAAVLRALGDVDDDTSYELLRQVLATADDRWGYRGAAATALAAHGRRATLSDLRRALKDSTTSEASRLQIAAAIEKLGKDH